MDVLDILRALARHRLLLAAGIIVAIVVALGVSKHSAGQRAATIASARLLIGPPNAAATILETITPQTLMMKAPLLADVLSTDAVRATVARNAGIRPSQLTVMGPAFGVPRVGVPLALAATRAATIVSTPYVLIVKADDQLPVLAMTAAAPSGAGAAKLIDAAGRTLRAYVQPQPTRTKSGKLRTVAPPLVLQPLGPIQVHTVVQGHPRVLATVAGFLVFGLWCGAIVVLSGLARVRRNARGPRAPRLDPVAGA